MPTRRGELTPVMRQHDDAKRAYPDAIVFFRMGDFYEMFYEDAVVASSLLGLTLTSRSKAEDVPMAGVPHHSAQGYIARLLAAGKKVAICEQMADPSKVKGLVPREVVRVITPGLVTVGDLDAREQSYLAVVDSVGAEGADRAFGLALLDLSTGELSAMVLSSADAVLGELARAAPREVILSPACASMEPLVPIVVSSAVVRVDPPLVDDAVAVLGRAVGERVARIAEAEHAPAALLAAARAADIARRATPGRALPISSVTRLEPSATMRIDEIAQAHLELVRSVDGSREMTLLGIVDRCSTPAGARLLRRRLLAPLANVGAIRRRQDEVEAFVVHARARRELRETLAGLGDLERISVRAALGEATPRDLGSLRDGLAIVPRAIEIAASLPGEARLSEEARALDPVADVSSALSIALADRPPAVARDGGIVRDGFDARLDEARKTKAHAAELIAALETRLREETNAQGLKIRFNSVFGYYMEVTKSHLAKVPAAWRRKQTVAGGERYTNGELDQLAADIESAEERSLSREMDIYADLVDRVATAADRIRRLAEALAAWDVAASLAEVAHERGYARPDVDDGDVIDIREGRHPVVEAYAAKDRFVPNDTTLDLRGAPLWLVTGPNMAGKSTLMRQVALIVVLAQMGSFVPAKSARIGIVDRLLSRVGASDAVARGESTFMVEMRETASILKHATRRSLVILDEIGRGTSTYDGLSIAWAVAEHLAEVTRCRALFATHYHELTELASTSSGVANVSVAAREHAGSVVFLHALVKGPASRSYGIAVARLAGVPESVSARAETILAGLEGDSARGANAPKKAPPPKEGAASADPQLDLFAARAATTSEHDALMAIRGVDIDRLTPLDALSLLASLKKTL